MRKVQNAGYQVYPAAASGIDPANGGAGIGSSGAWSQIVASTAAAVYVTHISFNWEAPTTGIEAEIDLGTGGAGAESVVSMVAASYEYGSAVGMYPGMVIPLPFPIAVATSTRIACRVRSSSTTLEPKNIKLIYVEQASLVAM